MQTQPRRRKPAHAKLDLNEILVFTRVVQMGSFTGAALALGMPKSSVSRKINELEDRVGSRLLQRTTRKLGLTSAGKLYFERCQRIVSDIEEAERALGSMQAAPCGLLRVSAPLSFGILGPLVATFLRRFPETQIDMVCTDRRVDLVEEGFDLAIRVGALEDSSLVARNLGTLRRVLVASPTYLRKQGTPRAPEELPEHACITFTGGTAPRSWTLQGEGRTVEINVAARLSINDFDLLAEAVRAGVGIAAMPAFLCAADLRAGRLRQVLPDWSWVEAPLQAVYPTARHLSPKVSAFIELLRERLSLEARR
jgi:DNA-binding transcriptional LysR family regulator